MTLLWRSGVQAAPGMGDMHRCVRVPAVEIGGYLAESSVNLARRLILTVVQRPRALRWATAKHATWSRGAGCRWGPMGATPPASQKVL